MSKNVLYIGQAFDPLGQVDVNNRKKVGITQGVKSLPIREGQLKRDAGTIMPFGYVVVKAWYFEEPVADLVESLIHNIRLPYAGEWILDDDDTLIDGITAIIDELKYESDVLNLELEVEYKDDKEFKRAKKNNSWHKLERELHMITGDVKLSTTTHLSNANGVLTEEGYIVDGTKYKTLGQACRKVVGTSTRCYDVFEDGNGYSLSDLMKSQGLNIL